MLIKSIRALSSFLRGPRNKHVLQHNSLPSGLRQTATSVYSKAGGLGDELMAAMAIQCAIADFPALRCTFYTRFHSLLNGLEGPERVLPLPPSPPKNAIALTYGAKQLLSVPAQMAAQLGAAPTSFTLALPERPVQLPVSWPADGRPIILIQTAASGWTPNKQWPSEHWEKFISSLPDSHHVIEIGAESALSSPGHHPRWRSLVGKTSFEEYTSCFRSAALFVGPISSGMHLAHAYQLPSVIIAGGYEAANFPYPLARQLGSDLPCAPCWLRTPCPYHRKCLHEITPDRVLREVLEQIKAEN